MKRLLILICVLCLLSTSTFAAINASDQLSSYETNAIHLGDGRIAMLVSVLGTDDMSELGSSHIFIYQKIGGSWVCVDTINKTADGMMSEDTFYHDDYVYYDGYTGEEYKIEIIIYAEDYSGVTDSRVCTHYVNT